MAFNEMVTKKTIDELYDFTMIQKTNDDGSITSEFQCNLNGYNFKGTGKTKKIAMAEATKAYFASIQK